MDRLQEIELRFQEIKAELDKEDLTDEQLDALTNETNSLQEERKSLLDKAEKRKKTLDALKRGAGKPVEDFNKLEKGKEKRMDTQEVLFRSAYLNKLRGIQLNEEEQRAMSSAASSVGGAIPEQTSNKILTKVETFAPLLQRIQLLKVKGAVSFVVEGIVNDAEPHKEGAKNKDSDDTLVTVRLFGYEITKSVRISETVKTMTIDDFEDWLTDQIAKKVAKEITRQILFGSGNGQAKGVNTITWNDDNSLEVGATASLTTKNVLDVISLLNAGYDAEATMIMSKKTLFQDLMPLQDKSKNSIVDIVNGKYYVFGYEVDLDDRMTIHEFILGDFTKYTGNLAKDVAIKSGDDFDNGGYIYMGTAIFDGKPAFENAFVKCKKGA